MIHNIKSIAASFTETVIVNTLSFMAIALKQAGEFKWSDPKWTLTIILLASLAVYNILKIADMIKKWKRNKRIEERKRKNPNNQEHYL